MYWRHVCRHVAICRTGGETSFCQSVCSVWTVRPVRRRQHVFRNLGQFFPVKQYVVPENCIIHHMLVLSLIRKSVSYADYVVWNDRVILNWEIRDRSVYLLVLVSSSAITWCDWGKLRKDLELADGCWSSTNKSSLLIQASNEFKVRIYRILRTSSYEALQLL